MGMKYVARERVFTVVFLGVVIVVLGGYALWYTVHRSQVIARVTQCGHSFAHPEAAPKVAAPDGSTVSLTTPCLLEPIPPTLGDLLHGDTAPSGVPERMQVNPYSFLDVLLGRYSVSPMSGAPCDQGATTTDCSAVVAQQPLSEQSLVPVPEKTTERIGNFTFWYPKGQGVVSEFGWEGVLFPGNHTLAVHGITDYTLFFFTTPAPLSSVNPRATTLDEYRHDYAIATTSPQRMVHILSSEDVTINDIPMLRQHYSVGYWTTNESGEQVFKSDSETDITDVLRYVFFDGETFVVFTSAHADSDNWVDYIAHGIQLL